MSQFPAQPGSRLNPVATDRTVGQTQSVCGLTIVIARKEPAFDPLCQPRAQCRQASERIVDLQQCLIRGPWNFGRIIKGHDGSPATALCRNAVACIVDERMAHRKCGRAQKVPLMSKTAAAAHTQERLVDESGGLQRVAGTDASALAARDAAHILVKDRQQLARGVLDFQRRAKIDVVCNGAVRHVISPLGVIFAELSLTVDVRIRTQPGFYWWGMTGSDP